jgi:PPOX class probable F420-dependent enzyme
MTSARRAVLATVSESGSPHLVPITFAVDADVIVTAVDQKPKRITDLTRLRNIRADPRVAVLADHYDDDWTTLWWVRADGRAEVLDLAQHDGVVRLLAEKYAQYRDDPPQGPLVRVRVQRWSGWSAG